MIWRVASLAVMLFLGASSLLAAECDCTDEDCADLTDLENLVSGLIIAFGLPAALSPAGAGAGETIRKTMGSGMPCTWIENAVNTLPARYMRKRDKATTMTFPPLTRVFAMRARGTAKITRPLGYPVSA